MYRDIAIFNRVFLRAEEVRCLFKNEPFPAKIVDVKLSDDGFPAHTLYKVNIKRFIYI